MVNRINIIMTGYEGFGVKRVWQNVINGFIERDYKVDIHVIENRGCSLESIGVLNDPRLSFYLPCKHFSKVKGKNRIENFFLSFKKILHLNNELKFVIDRVKGCDDVFLYQSPTLNFALPSEMKSFRCFWMMPNVISGAYPFDVNKKLYNWFIKKNDIIVLPNSHFTSDSLGGEREKQVVIYPGTKFDFEEESIRPRIEFGERKDIVLCIVASLTHIKGHKNLIFAISNLRNKGIRIGLLVCGGPLDSSFGQSLIKLTKDLQLEESVIFLGQVENPYEIFHSSDIVISTTTIAEGFGLSIVEAMGAGKPVIANRLGGPSETIIDNYTGWLLNSASIESIEIGIERALASKPLWSDFSIRAEQRAKREFSCDKMINELEMVFFE